MIDDGPVHGTRVSTSLRGLVASDCGRWAQQCKNGELQRSEAACVERKGGQFVRGDS